MLDLLLPFLKVICEACCLLLQLIQFLQTNMPSFGGMFVAAEGLGFAWRVGNLMMSVNHRATSPQV